MHHPGPLASAVLPVLTITTSRECSANFSAEAAAGLSLPGAALRGVYRAASGLDYPR